MSERRELVGELLHCFGFYLKVRYVNVNGGVYFKLALTRLSERDTLTSKKNAGNILFWDIMHGRASPQGGNEVSKA